MTSLIEEFTQAKERTKRIKLILSDQFPEVSTRGKGFCTAKGGVNAEGSKIFGVGGEAICSS